MASKQTSIETKSLKSVTLDILTVMKILKHGRDAQPSIAAGMLLGVLKKGSVYINNSFPLPQTSEADASDHQERMIDCLSEVGVDDLPVGFYQVCNVSSAFTQDTATTLFTLQRAQPTVFIVYDPQQTMHGKLAIQAFRLSENAMRVMKSKSFSAAKLTASGVGFDSFFEELRVTVSMSIYAKAMMPLLTAELGDTELFDQFELTTQSFMERNVSQLVDNIDQLASFNQKYHKHKQESTRRETEERKRREDDGLPALSKEEMDAFVARAAPAPQHLNALLVNTQISSYCAQMSKFSSQSLGKLYLTQAIQPTPDQEE
eukprot:m.352914 g.352914  ORF g.352914 m.352914 type:complete len:317 (+) comp16642_c0_seq1:144-1094(+)